MKFVTFRAVYKRLKMPKQNHSIVKNLSVKATWIIMTQNIKLFLLLEVLTKFIKYVTLSRRKTNLDHILSLKFSNGYKLSCHERLRLLAKLCK